MKKKMIRNLVILLVVIMLLVGAYAYLTRPDEPEEITNIEIATCAKAEVQEIRVENAGGSFTLLYDAESKLWQLKEYPGVPVYQVKASNLAYTVSSVYAQAVIEENPENIEKYGLSEPKGTVAVLLQSGEKRTFLLGNELSVGTDSYFMKEGTPTVYTVPTIAWEDITLEASAFFDMELPEFESENVVALDILEKDGSHLRIEKSGNAEDGYAADWTMTAPFCRAAENSAVENTLLASLKNLKAINAFAPDELRTMVPDASTASAVITVTLKEESITYYVGENTESGTYFAMEGEPLLYLASSTSFDFLSDDPFVYMSKTVKNIPIKEVSHVEVTLNGTLYTLAVGDSFTLNGQEIPEEDARSLYAEIIGLTASGISEETRLFSDGQNEITFGKKDGTAESVILKKIGEKTFAADSGEGLVFTISKEALDALSKQFEKAL